MEKREFPRIAVTFPVQLMSEDGESPGQIVATGRTIDLNRSGAKLMLDRPLPTSFVGMLSIDMPPCYSSDPIKALPVQAKTNLIWGSLLARKDRFRCGVDFLEFSESDLSPLKNILRYEEEKSLKTTSVGLSSYPNPKVAFTRVRQSCNMYSVDLTVGCENACLYCHFFKMNEEHWQKDNSLKLQFPIPVDISPIYSMSMDEFPKSTIYLSPASDPFSGTARELTHEFLSFLLPKGLRFAISTKGVIPERSIKLFEQYLSQIEVEVGITNIDTKRNFVLEPNCPSANDRLEVLHHLVEIGCLVGVRMDPIFPLVDDNIESLECTIRAVAKTGAKYIIGAYLFAYGKFLRKLRREPLLKDSLECLTEESYIVGGTAMSVPLELKKQVYEKMDTICRTYGITFSVCGCKEVRLKGTSYSLVCKRSVNLIQG